MMGIFKDAFAAPLVRVSEIHLTFAERDMTHQWFARSRYVLMAASVLAVPAMAVGATRRDDVADSSYTGLSALPGFASSGYISIDQDATPGGGFDIGSGTLVAPNWVLTAAHVVTRSVSGSGEVAYPAAQITFGQGPTRPGSLVGSFGVAEVIVHPGWTGDVSAGTDVALIRLTSNALATPAPLYDVSTLGSEKNRSATIVGYQGSTGTGLTGNTTSNLARRGQTNVVDAFGGENTLGQDAGGGSGLYPPGTSSPSVMLTDFDSPDNGTSVNNASDPSNFYNLMGSGDPTATEGAQVGGDSGGGLFINVGGTEYLAGVTSFVGWFSNSPFGSQRSTQGFYGDYNGYTRVSQHLPFITSAIPEPSFVGLFAVAGLFLARRRRH